MKTVRSSVGAKLITLDPLFVLLNLFVVASHAPQSTHNQYLREDLAKHGLAVAGDSGSPSFPAGSEPARPTRLPQAAAAAASASPSPSLPQRPSSYTAASAPASASTGTGHPSAADSKPRGRLASLEPVDAPSPPSTQKQQHQPPKAAEPRPVPGKLGASRLDSFRGGSSSCGNSVAAGRGQAREESGVSSKEIGVSSGGASDSSRRWTVGPSSSPSKSTPASSGNEEPRASAHPAETSSSGRGVSTPTVPSVGSLAARFGERVRIDEGKVPASEGSRRKIGGGGGKGRISELARKFEK